MVSNLENEFNPSNIIQPYITLSYASDFKITSEILKTLLTDVIQFSPRMFSLTKLMN